MTSRLFKGIPSLREVECTGRNLNPEVKLLALQIYRLPSHELLATLNVISSNCVTLGEMASCDVNTADSHQSKLRVLVADLDEGESRQFKCTGNTLDSYGLTNAVTWNIIVTRYSKYTTKELRHSKIPTVSVFLSSSPSVHLCVTGVPFLCATIFCNTVLSSVFGNLFLFFSGLLPRFFMPN